MSQPATLVLVHGAMNGPWVWERVTPLLEEAGVPYVLVDRGFGEPRRVSSDPNFDAERVREAIAEAARPVVLVGHSQGGVGITYGGVDDERVRHLVYIDASVPGSGAMPAETTSPELMAAVRPTEHGITLDPDVALRLVYNDCDPEDGARALARHDPQALPPDDLEEPAALAWREHPSTYVVCVENVGRRPEASRADVTPGMDVVEWPTGHMPLISRPDLVARLLVELAERYAE